MRAFLGTMAIAGALLIPAASRAQQTTQPPVKRRQAPIEIRGQVPTPQVVTVRPREVPAYSRQVLVPNFYDHDFWPSILPGYKLISKRQLTGVVPIDSSTLRSDRAATDSTRSPVPVAPDSVRQGVAPAAQPATQPPVIAPGTPPASRRR
jgi:hypothetical protein